MTALRQRMLEDMQIRNVAPATQRSYVEHVSRFARHVGRSPAGLGPEEIRTYQVYLTTEKHLAPSVEQGKGRKDRYVMLSPRLLDILRD